MKYFIPFAFLLLAPAEMKRSQSVTVVRIERLGNCPDYPSVPNRFISSEVYPIGKTLYARGVFEFQNNYTRITKSVATIKKCLDRNDPHCELFQNWRFGEETCHLITAKGFLWTPLFQTVPAIACPVKKGLRRLENATLDMQRLKLINFPEDGYWKVQLLADADHIKNVICYYLECSFVRVRL